jgi:hypothetical protein
MSEQEHKAVFTADNRDLNKKADQVASKMQNLSSKVKSLAAGFAAAFSIKAVLNFMTTSMKAYDEEAKASGALLVALKGRRDIQQDIIKQASELQGKTLFADDQTIEAAARMAMVLGTNKKAIQDLLPLVQDLAQAKLQGNLVTAADMVAKSVGSETNALARYGIQIEGTVGSAERLESAMRELNRQVGGQAAAAAEIGLGPLTILKNIFGDLKEQIGGAIVNSNLFKDAIKDVTSAVKEVNDRLSDQTVIQESGISKWDKFIFKFARFSKVGKKAIDDMADLIRVQNEQKAVQDQSNTNIEAATDALNDYATAIRTVIAAPSQGGFDQLQASISGLLDASKLAESSIAIKTVADELTLAQQAAQSFADQMIQAGIESKGSMLDFARTAVMVARKVIATYLAETIAAAVKSAFISVPFPFNVIAAGVAGGTAAALFNSLIPNFAAGGAAYGPTLALVGEAPGISKSNPEYIGTARQLSQMGTGGRLTARISRSDLLFILNEGHASNGRNY